MDEFGMMRGMIEPHRVAIVATSLIEVDAGLWDAVRLVVPVGEESMGRTEESIFPVAARAGRLVLLSGFEHFLAAVDAGATQVRVWRVEVEDGEDLRAYAVALSTRLFDDSDEQQDADLS